MRKFSTVDLRLEPGFLDFRLWRDQADPAGDRMDKEPPDQDIRWAVPEWPRRIDTVEKLGFHR